MLEGVIQSLHRGRSCLALPKRKTLEELIKNPQLVSFSQYSVMMLLIVLLGKSNEIEVLIKDI